MYRCCFVTVHRTVLQTADSFDFTIITHTNILDITRIDNGDMTSDTTGLRGPCVGIIQNHLLHPADQLRPMAIERHEISLMCRKIVVDIHFTSSCFVQNGHFYPIAETAFTVDQNDIHILDKRMIANLIIGYIVLDVFNQAIVADRHLVQGDMTQTGMFRNASGKRESIFKHTETHMSREAGMMHVLGAKPFGHFNIFPIVCNAGLRLQTGNLFFR